LLSRYNTRASKKLLKLNKHLVNIALFTIVCFLSGCSSQHSLAPVKTLDRPPSEWISTHYVSAGETLYSISWRYGLSVPELRGFNGLSEADAIFVGQKLYLRGQRPTNNAAKITHKQKTVVAATTSVERSSSTKNEQKSPIIEKKHTRGSAPANGQWIWPSKGKVISEFKAASRTRQGIDIAGKMGESVHAVTGGKVVYTGSALNGYGKLIIVEHANDVLTAYGHNSRILVAEGEEVTRGQRIALMGDTDADRVKLLFEVRLSGKPVNPRRYLPAN